MHVLRLQHGVNDFDEWKKLFDNDPLGRQESGVVRYRVLRANDDPNLVMVDLEFGTAEEADRMHDKLKELWTQVTAMNDPSALSAEIVESHEF